MNRGGIRRGSTVNFRCGHFGVFVFARLCGLRFERNVFAFGGIVGFVLFGKTLKFNPDICAL